MAFTYCPLWISLEVRKFSRTKNLPFTSLKARFYWRLFSRGKIKESLWRYIRLRNSKWSLCEFNGAHLPSRVFFSFSAVFRNYLLDKEKFLLNWYDLWKHLFFDFFAAGFRRPRGGGGEVIKTLRWSVMQHKSTAIKRTEIWFSMWQEICVTRMTPTCDGEIHSTQRNGNCQAWCQIKSLLHPERLKIRARFRAYALSNYFKHPLWLDKAKHYTNVYTRT